MINLDLKTPPVFQRTPRNCHAVRNYSAMSL